ncbi:MAG: acyl-CoA dehydrogenase [Pseudomonadales bacterium]|nr:acyl-CoA dehydrogenase [Pseudomonadales bacterium]
MDFSLTEEQRLLKDSLDKFVQQEYDFESRRAIVENDAGFSAKHWQTFADLGWLAIPFSEEAGGLGGGPVETMLLMESFGKGLVAEPWLTTVLMSGYLIENLGSEEQKQRYLPAIVQGEMQVAVAVWEQQHGFDNQVVSTSANAVSGGYEINGQKEFVINGQNANCLLVSAKIDDGNESSLGLFCVDTTIPGISTQAFKTVEGGRAANVTFDNVVLDESALLASGEAVEKAIQHCMALGTFAVCAEAVGIMELLYNTTVEYTKTRKQFGVPIGKFQVLQHRMVNMFILYEQSQSLLLMAAIKLSEGGEEAQQAVSALKTWIGQAGRKLGQESIQLHGGMGMTDELNVGYYFKRLTAIDALFGNADMHLDRYAKALS